MRKSIIVFILVLSGITQALPIDWKGSFYVDHTRIDNFRRTEQCLGTENIAGSQEIACTPDENAIFQNYIFRLNPEIIINDAVSVKAEISSGYARGGFLGDDFSSNIASGSYFNSFPSGADTLNINQIYAELYTETATLKIGRYAKHWGMGLLLNDGSKTKDRYLSMYDGVEALFQFGNFSIVPHLAKIGTGTKLLRDEDINEMGISFLYDNSDKDLKAGLLYARREAATASTLGNMKAKVWDFFLEKNWEKWKLALEVPVVTGTSLGTSIKGSAYIGEVLFKANQKWQFGLRAGFVSGDDPTSTDNEALSLNPNFKIANLMFAYNHNNLASNTNAYDSAVSNAYFASLASAFTTGNWTWNMGLIWAQAAEVYATQDKDLGFEIDFGFDYRWYPGVVLSFDFGYHLAGDYYAYTGGGTQLEVENPFMTRLGLSIDF